MTDQGFPIITYRQAQSPRAWGRMHGESYRGGIHELFEIRFELMREKNSSLSSSHIRHLAEEQWSQTAMYDRELTEELEGICEGADVSHEQIVVLNNYTDFRDIQMPEEGCSVVFVNYHQGPIAGQTWDMHGSAKQYVCCIEIPAKGSEIQTVMFSLVGCVGMMGYTSAGTMVGVSNINTNGAVAGAMWPAVVRKTLRQPTHSAMAKHLTHAPVTSGHNYLLASSERAEMWEVLPGLSERVGVLLADEQGHLFHTNHCLGAQTTRRENATARNSTSHIRYRLLERKTGRARTLDDVYQLLNDHENYPKSICSNFQAGSQDPAITCGGAVGNLATAEVVTWRGDRQYDANFKQHTFQLAHT